MQDDRTDVELIEAAKSGNQRAFDILILRYQSRISKVIARFVKDRSEVLDVAQETFIKAYKALDKFRGDSSFYTWLYRIAVNTSKNYLISKGHRLPDVDLGSEDMEKFLVRHAARENETPEKLLMRDEVKQTVFNTIEHLPADLRKTIILRELEGLSYEDIAQIMGCPVGTVRSRIFRARNAIDRNVQPFLQQ